MARRKTQSSMVPRSFQDRGGRLPARQWRRFAERRAPLSIGLTVLNRLEAGEREAKSSASSWRGLLVVPGGAPAPPGCPCCVHEPAGAAPRPASRTPRD